MDGLSAAVNIIALATALKDIVELEETVRNSLGKVKKNRESLLFIAVEISRTIELLRSLVQRQSDVFNLPAFQEPLNELEDELTYLFNRCRKVWSKNSGLGGKRAFLQAWRKASVIEGEIDNLEKKLNFCYQRFMLQATAQIFINSEEQRRRTTPSDTTESHSGKDIPRDDDAFEELVGISQSDKPKLKEAWKRASKHVNSEDLTRVETYLNLKAQELLKSNAQKLLTDGGEGVKLELLLTKPNIRTPEEIHTGNTEKSRYGTSSDLNEGGSTDRSDLPASPIDEGHVYALYEQALQLFDSGYKEEALVVMEEVLEQFSSLPKSDASSIQLNRLKYLRLHADCLSAVGRHEEATVAMKKVLEQFSVLPESESSTGLLDQQRCVQAYVDCLNAVGRYEEASAQVRNGVKLLRVLAYRFPGEYDRNLAVGLVNSSARMHALKNYKEALQYGLEGLKLLRKIENDDSSVSNPSVPRALLRLVFVCTDLNHNKEALAYAREAAEKTRQLTLHYPDTYATELASCLCYLARCLSRAGYHQDAAKTAAEAMPVYRSFVYRYSDEQKMEIIEKLLQHSKFLLSSGSYQAALVCGQLGVNVRRDFTIFGSESTDPEFALSLRHLSCCLLRVGNREETALETIKEAICIHEFLKGRDPETYEERLAWDLAWLVQILCSTKQYNTALVPARRAVDMYRRFSRDRPSSDNLQALKFALQQHLDCLRALSRDKEIELVEEEILKLKVD